MIYSKLDMGLGHALFPITGNNDPILQIDPNHCDFIKHHQNIPVYVASAPLQPQKQSVNDRTPMSPSSSIFQVYEDFKGGFLWLLQTPSEQLGVLP